MTPHHRYLLQRLLLGDRRAFWRVLPGLVGAISRPFARRPERAHRPRSARRDGANDRTGSSLAPDLDLSAWIEQYDQPGAADLATLAASAAGLGRIPVMVCFDAASLPWLAATRRALEALVGLEWQAWLLLGPDCGPEARRTVDAVAAEDTRFAVGTPPAFDQPVLVLLGGTLPRPHGPRLLVDALGGDARPGKGPAQQDVSAEGRSRSSGPHGVRADLAYADETAIDAAGRLLDPWFKPGFSALLVTQGRLLGGMVALRSLRVAELTDPAGCLTDRALRAGPAACRHVAHVLSHTAGPGSAHWYRRLRDATCFPALARHPLVSILIPTRNQWGLLQSCLASIGTSAWPADRREVIVVDNGSDDPQTLAGLAAAEAAGTIRLLRAPGPFNFARINNLAAATARGEVLILLNNDTEVIDCNWIGKLAVAALAPEVGAVGARLLYPDRTVQHAGVVLGVRGAALHAFAGLPETAGGYQGLARITREVGAVTGACLAVRRDHYLSVGGLDEAFRVSFNDVLLCLALARQGLRTVCLGDALLVHHESKSRGQDLTPAQRALAIAEAAAAWRIARPQLADDPCYSPCLSLDEPYRLAVPPRRRPAWRTHSQQPQRAALLLAAFASGRMTRAQQAQAAALQAAGCEVFVFGLIRPTARRYPGCQTAQVSDARSAAAAIAAMDADLVVVHGPPFLGVVRWLGSSRTTVYCDHTLPLSSQSAPSTDPLFEQDLHERAMYQAVLTASGGQSGSPGGLPESLVRLLQPCG